MREKSRTSLERAWMRTCAITLFDVSVKGEVGRERAYMTMLQSSQTIPRVHPTVLSPRTLRQEKMRSSVNAFPATSALKRIRAAATT